METEEQKVKRVADEINAVLEREGCIIKPFVHVEGSTAKTGVNVFVLKSDGKEGA